MKTLRYAVALAALLATTGLRADEGMWTFDRPPLQTIQQRYGFSVTTEWLDHLRLSSVRFPDGSGSFVSPNGLVLTNHHVALDQLQKISTPQKNYVADGFYARTRGDEVKSADAELNVLMSDRRRHVARGRGGRQGGIGAGGARARKAEIARIEKESVDRTGLRSDIVTLYQGAQYWLYRYKKYTDVRLVFAPEQQMAFFGGDPDNFTYPRHDLDFALFRVYENDAPIRSEHFLKWNAKGAAENELVFVTGHPGSTDRDDTVAELETERDVVYPASLQVVKRRIGVLRQYCEPGRGRSPPGQRPHLRPRERAQGLHRRIQRTARREGVREEGRRRAGASRPDRAARPSGKPPTEAPGPTCSAPRKSAAGSTRPSASASSAGRRSRRWACTLVQYAAEVAKPDAARLDGFHDAQLPSLKFQLSSPAPVYPALEEALLADALQESLEELGPNDPFVKTALAGRLAERRGGGAHRRHEARRSGRPQGADGGRRSRRSRARPIRSSSSAGRSIRSPAPRKRHSIATWSACRRRRAKRSARRALPSTARPRIPTRPSRCGCRTAPSAAIR